ncbi:hypothetical protein HID58_062440, partial [Brassica napus]
IHGLWRRRRVFSPALDICVESTYLRHSLLHVSLCYLLVTGSISLSIWRKEVPTDATTKMRASNLRRAATRGPIPSFGPSSSDESGGFSRRRKALVPSTHSSFVLNSLSSLVEDLSCLTYIYVVVYAYCLR